MDPCNNMIKYTIFLHKTQQQQRKEINQILNSWNAPENSFQCMSLAVFIVFNFKN